MSEDSQRLMPQYTSRINPIEYSYRKWYLRQLQLYLTYQLGDWEDTWDTFKEDKVQHWQTWNRSEEDRFQYHHQQQWDQWHERR